MQTMIRNSRDVKWRANGSRIGGRTTGTLCWRFGYIYCGFCILVFGFRCSAFGVWMEAKMISNGSQKGAKWAEMEPKVRPMVTKRVPKWCQNGPWRSKMEPWHKCILLKRFWLHIGKPFGSQNLQISNKIDPKLRKMRSGRGSGTNTNFVKKLYTKTRGVDL